MTEGERDLVLASDVPGRAIAAYQPTTANDAFERAKWIVKSGFYPSLKVPEQAFVVMAQGNELGLDMMQSLNSLWIIQGRPTLSAQAMVALVHRSGKASFLKCVESTREHATWRTKRKDDPDPTPVEVKFTIEDAREMQLLGRDQWKKMPKTMLVWRGAAMVCRLVYPDVVLGLYDPDELEGGFAEGGEIYPPPHKPGRVIADAHDVLAEAREHQAAAEEPKPDPAPEESKPAPAPAPAPTPAKRRTDEERARLYKQLADLEQYFGGRDGLIAVIGAWPEKLGQARKAVADAEAAIAKQNAAAEVYRPLEEDEAVIEPPSGTLSLSDFWLELKRIGVTRDAAAEAAYAAWGVEAFSELSPEQRADLIDTLERGGKE